MIWRWLVISALAAGPGDLTFLCDGLPTLGPGKPLPQASDVALPPNEPTKLLFAQKKMLFKYYDIDADRGVSYLGPQLLETCRVTVHQGRLYDDKGALLQRGPDSIFVMDAQGTLYVFNPRSLASLLIQHSSFLAGKAVASAGRIEVVDGVIVRADAKSGHYHPEKEQLLNLRARLAELHYDLPLDRLFMHYDQPSLATP